MTSETFRRNFVQVIKAAKLCLDQDLQIPALILVYSLIDTFAWAVAGPREKNGRTRFESWVSQWVCSHDSLPCTPTELYAARCAVLHSLTSKADLNVSGKVRQVVYAWGPAKRSVLEDSIEAIGQSNLVGVHINELLDAVVAGMDRTFTAATTDTRLRNNLDAAATLHFAHMKRDTLEQLMELHGQHKTLERLVPPATDA